MRRWAVTGGRRLRAAGGRRVWCAPTLLALGVSMGLAQAVLAADPPPHELVAEGNKALADGDGAKAMELYDKAAAQAQDSPEIAYNQGVVYYRGSDYDKAAERFSKALSTSDAGLDARARFNLGNCAYASALKVKDKPEEAIEKLKKASDFFQDVLESHPDDKDARGNLERAQLLIRQLKEQKPPESQPQSQPSSQPTSRPQSQPQSQPASRPESQPSQQDQEEQGQKQGQQQQGEDRNGEAQQGGQEEEGKKKDAQQAQADKKDGNQNEEKQEQARALPATQQAMSKEEAQRLLQLIRDKQRQRMEALERQSQGPMQPVEKDW
ncbi:MAG TPA: hypothetical protein PKY77_08145 [Phycisphaerae bacterium]|nr:hypothetical protein [Phycisphaerae bacterium]HRY68662.1 hypothetical protein [Phycisphaerae bacterium]HSA25488.1 hypothetical protein [Phycisphaerae bacterium]